MQMNYLAIIVAAFIPIIVGSLWFNSKTCGNIWMREADVTFLKLRKRNVLVIFFITLILSFFLAFFLQQLTIHQTGVVQLTGGDVAMAEPSYFAFMADYGSNFRTFQHGALHGFLSGIFLFLPVITINGLFEAKSWKYIFLNSGYWTVTLTIMGAIICGWV
jgi:hypothetical protein